MPGRQVPIYPYVGLICRVSRVTGLESGWPPTYHIERFWVLSTLRGDELVHWQ
jgi:hypothetical protein